MLFNIVSYFLTPDPKSCTRFLRESATVFPQFTALRFPDVVGPYDNLGTRHFHVVGGNTGRPGSPGCHDESEVRMVKVDLLTVSASPRRLT